MVARTRRPGSPSPEELRLLGKVARMYHERGIRQPQIAQELSISQARVSRLLRQAVDVGIVRTVVTMPEGTNNDLEDELQQRYGLRDVVVADTSGSEINVALGAAAAAYLDVTLVGGHIIGISTWSETLLMAALRMGRRAPAVADRVVQLMGGLGDPAVQTQATQLVTEFANRVGAVPVLLPAPGLVSGPGLRRAILKDASIADVTGVWSTMTDTLVGIGSLEPSPLLARSGNAVSPEEQEELRSLGAVGDVCIRYFDRGGRHLVSTLDRRVIGASPKQLLAPPRRIGVAGGKKKYAAVRASIIGGWVNVLITDVDTATALLDEPDD